MGHKKDVYYHWLQIWYIVCLVLLGDCSLKHFLGFGFRLSEIGHRFWFFYVNIVPWLDFCTLLVAMVLFWVVVFILLYIGPLSGK